MGGGAEPKSRPSRLAFHHRQCPHETETFVSKDSCLTEYYFNIDPVIVRLVFVVAVLFGGISPLVYIILWIVMPEESAIRAQPTLPQHPRPVEEWKYDPYTGEPIRREP